MAAKKRARKSTSARRTAKKPPRKKVQAVPAAYGSLTPGLVFKDARPAIDWYGKVFGARVRTRLDMPDGRLMHAELQIGDSLVMLGDEAPERGIRSAESLGGSGTALMHYVKDCDAVFARAVAAGAKPLSPPADMFWGDRYSQVVDPFGHRWGIATHTADLSPKAMQKAADGFLAQMAGQGGAPAGG